MPNLSLISSGNKKRRSNNKTQIIGPSDFVLDEKSQSGSMDNTDPNMGHKDSMELVKNQEMKIKLITKKHGYISNFVPNKEN